MTDAVFRAITQTIEIEGGARMRLQKLLQVWSQFSEALNRRELVDLLQLLVAQMECAGPFEAQSGSLGVSKVVDAVSETMLLALAGTEFKPIGGSAVQ